MLKIASGLSVMMFYSEGELISLWWNKMCQRFTVVWVWTWNRASLHPTTMWTWRKNWTGYKPTEHPSCHPPWQSLCAVRVCLFQAPVETWACTMADNLRRYKDSFWGNTLDFSAQLCVRWQVRLWLELSDWTGVTNPFPTGMRVRHGGQQLDHLPAGCFHEPEKKRDAAVWRSTSRAAQRRTSCQRRRRRRRRITVWLLSDLKFIIPFVRWSSSCFFFPPHSLHSEQKCIIRQLPSVIYIWSFGGVWVWDGQVCLCREVAGLAREN